MSLDIRIEGVDAMIKRLSDKMLGADAAVQPACLRGAHVLEGAIKAHIRDNPHELKSPDRRGQTFHQGLIDTGALLNSVTVRPIHAGAEVGPTAEYAVYHECGAPNVGLPARPFVRPAVDEKGDEVRGMVAEAVRRALEK